MMIESLIHFGKYLAAAAGIGVLLALLSAARHRRRHMRDRLEMRRWLAHL